VWIWIGVVIMGIGFIAIPGGMFVSEFINEIMKTKGGTDTEEESNLKCLKCNSNLIQTYKNPILSFEGNTVKYNLMHRCEECNFI